MAGQPTRYACYVVSLAPHLFPSLINCHNIAMLAVSAQSRWLFPWYARPHHFCCCNNRYDYGWLCLAFTL